MYKTSAYHQLLLLNSNSFYNAFKTDNKKAEILNAIKNPLHRTAINKFRLGNDRLLIETESKQGDTVPKTPGNLKIFEVEMNLMFCSLAHFIISFAPLFKDLDFNLKVLFPFLNSIDLFICRSVDAFFYEL